MATAVLSTPALTLGEVGPALFGRFDTARMHTAAATMRNLWPSFRGGAYSRAGTAFVGFSKQTGRSVPPRLIPFQFNINQGLALEFGDYYMRVVSDGAFVTESPFAITGASQTNPAVLTYQALSTAMSASANIGAVTASYVRGDNITLAGGTFTTPAVLRVQNTTLARLSLLAAGTGYTIGDTITLLGGTNTLPPVLTVLTLSGSGVATFAISNGGSFITNGLGTFTQASTSGSGSGATFNGGLFGPNQLEIFNDGAYTAVPSNPVNQASSSGAGLGATYTMVWATPAALVNGDWVAVADVGGMTQINGQSFIVADLTATTFSLRDVYNHPIDATAFGAYTSGGTASRIYTLTTLYAEADLAYLKFTQSADVMSICCLNQQSLTEYPPQDLTRNAGDDWSFAIVNPLPTVSPPTGVAAAASSSGSVAYSYEVTAVNPDDGTESIASIKADVASAVNIAATAGSINITWNPVLGVQQYNVYKATPGIGFAPPAGALYGFAGTTYGGSFIDSNIVPDFSQVPPTHSNPFAKGQITGLRITAAGSSASFTYTLNSLTGSGAVLTPIVVSNELVGFVINDPGQNYLPTDTITISNSATATLVVGPTSGTYPSVVAYFQQRRDYANTINQPDTYFMSQPGSYTNFDFRIPTIDTDAITGTPWAVEVNGIQFMVPMPGGLVVMTGLSAWQVTGAGGSSLQPTPITPVSQQAQPQAYNGCSATVPPIKIDNDIIYIQAKGSIYRDLAYDFYVNIYTGTDLTVNSPQLFTGYTIKEHAWCEEPYRLLWAVRNDGILLSFTWLKPEKVQGFARHDTDGRFESVCSITEPPVDALYLAASRMFGDNAAYVIERMDDRIWPQAEQCWCVDCGFSLNQPNPDATLTASSATGLGSLTGTTNLTGTGYTAAAIFSVVDEGVLGAGSGTGSGAVPVVTLDGNGAPTSITFSPVGSNYTNPKLVVNDPARSGSGFSATIVLDNSMTFESDADVFALGNVGSVIRMGGGIAEITGFTDARTITADMLSPIVSVRVNAEGDATPLPAASGDWSMTAPVASVYVPQLAGASVTGLYDGNVIPPQTVPANGVVPLPAPATAVIIGLGFQAQVQSVYLDIGEPTTQGQRKKVAAVTTRLQASRGVKVGGNQVDGSTLSPAQIAPLWNNMKDVNDKAQKPYNGLCEPLYTGDTRIPIPGGFNTPGQVALQQDSPLPMEILALIPEVLGGDKPEQAVGQENRPGKKKVA